MSAVYLVVGLRAKPEKIDQVRSDLIEVVAPSRKESGCITVSYTHLRAHETGFKIWYGVF
ncbi:putative quinol monooxygenase, partial [Acinetobacter baumannii]